MKKQPQSIYDLAELTGVSYATVSRVLSGNGRAAPKTRQLILETADKYNFRPKMKARKCTVALLIDVLDSSQNRYIPTVLANLVEGLSSHDVAIEIFTRSNIRHFRNCYVDALIALPWNESINKLLLDLKHIPKVTFNYAFLEGCSNVSSNHEQSGRLAAEYLFTRGHTHAGIVLATQDQCNMKRLEGFRAFYAQQGITLDMQLCGFVSSGSPLMVIDQILNASPTALFLGLEDTMALWSSLRSRQIRIPEDISIIAMENELYSCFMDPPVTTISQQLQKVAEEAVGLIIQKINQRNEKPESILIENSLIERQSVVDRR